MHTQTSPQIIPQLSPKKIVAKKGLQYKFLPLISHDFLNDLLPATNSLS
jgi:hypothetical protein